MEEIITTKGIYKDINDSNYSVVKEDMRFYFTSWRIMNNFIRDCEEQVDLFNELYMKKFGVSLNFDKIALLLFYKKYEVRGFKVEIEGVEYSCLEKIHLNLV